eukprot:1161110-Pelagomonas_calceolata.AAC.5
MQVGTPSVALLQRDTLSPSMANTESWGGLAHCHAVTALEVLQRLDVQELGCVRPEFIPCPKAGVILPQIQSMTHLGAMLVLATHECIDVQELGCVYLKFVTAMHASTHCQFQPQH